MATTTTTTDLSTTPASNESFTGNSTTYFWENQIVLHTSVIAVLIIFLLLIVLSNSCLLTTLLSSPQLRATLRNQLILSLTVSNLASGIIGAPFDIYVLVNNHYARNCFNMLFRDLVTEFVCKFVATWGVLLLSVRYLVVVVSDYQGPKWLLGASARLRRVVKALVALWPWLAVLSILFPVFLAGRRPGAFSHTMECSLYMVFTRSTIQALSALSFYLPAYLLLILLPVLVVLYCRNQRRSGVGEMSAGLITSAEGEERSPWLHVLSGAACFLLELPLQVLYLVLPHFRLSLRVTWTWFLTAQALQEALAFLLPALWLLLLPDLRVRFTELLARLPCLASRAAALRYRRWSQSVSGSVSYRDMPDP